MLRSLPAGQALVNISALSVTYTRPLRLRLAYSGGAEGRCAGACLMSRGYMENNQQIRAIIYHSVWSDREELIYSHTIAIGLSCMKKFKAFH